MNNKDRAFAEIKLKNIEQNFINIKKYVKTKVMCIIKADAYGHGILQVAQTLERVCADYFGVATLNEAIMLRQSGVYAPILLLGFFEEKYIIDLIENNITATVYDLNTALEIQKMCKMLNKTAKIHIKIDTGMRRLGFSFDQNYVKMIKEINNLSNIFIEGIYTHFATADDENQSEFLKKQANLFENLIKQLKDDGICIPIKHISASGAIINYPEYNYDLVRAGLILYGYSPSENQVLDLKPAMTLMSKVAQIKDLAQGEGVSYGLSYIAKQPKKIAVITIGYADGYLRANSNNSYMLINGKKANVLGNICMDMCMVDVTNIDVKKGDIAVLFGFSGEKLLKASEIATFSNTITYEILCSVSKRVPRIYTLD